MVVAWGDVPAPTPALSHAVQVAAGEAHSLAVKADGTVTAWGDNSYGQTAVPADLRGVAAVAAGARHSLALKTDGTVVGWGTGFPKQAIYADGRTETVNAAVPPPGLDRVIALATGSSHAIALRQDGSVVLWGSDHLGGPPHAAPSSLGDVTAVAAGDHFSVALRRDGTVLAWGQSASKLNGFVDVAVVPAGLTGVIAISATLRHTLALKSDGTVMGWGSNGSGETTTPPGLTNVTAIAAGYEHSVALKADGTVAEWGRGIGPRSATAGLTDVIAISASAHTVAITKMGHPTAPVDLAVRYKGTTATVTWAVPTHRGSPGISHYIVRRSPDDAGVRVPVAQMTHQFDGVRSDNGLTVSVEAEAIGGRGPAAVVYAQRTNIRTFRPDNGRWHARAGTPIAYGTSGDIPVPGDYTGAGLAQMAVFRSSDGTWRVRGSQPVRYGRAGDIPVPADYNGDGTLEMAVFRPSNGNWYIRGIGTLHLGAAGDIPVPADYDGNGTDDVIIFRPSNGIWYTVEHLGNYRNVGIRNVPLAAGSRRFGTRGDIPTPGDWNGDGTVELGVYRPSTGTWYQEGRASVRLGQQGDVPVPGDYDVNGATDIGVYRPSNSTFYLRGVGAVQLGRIGDLPLVLGPGRAPFNS